MFQAAYLYVFSFFFLFLFLLYMAFVHFARLFFKRVTKFVSFLVRHQDNFHWGWHLCACVYAYLFHSFSLILFIYVRLILSSLAMKYLWIHEMSASLIYICNQFKLGLYLLQACCEKNLAHSLMRIETVPESERMEVVSFICLIFCVWCFYVHKHP